MEIQQLQQLATENTGSELSPNADGASEEQKPITCAQIKQCEVDDNEQILQLRQELSFKQEELEQKNQIIKQLQQRCMLVSIYQKKIEMLESKACQLERILDRLEKDNTVIENTKAKLQNTQPTILECEEFVLRQHSPTNQVFAKTSSKKLPSCESIIKQNRQQLRINNKENRKSSLKVKQNLLFQEETKQKNPEDKRKEKAPTFFNYEQKVSSKFLNPDREEKHKDIDTKFSKIKQTIQTQGKPKSTKNIDEIYSILNNHKMRREELAIKGINQKLQNILNESVRLSNNGSPAKKSPNQRFSTHSNHCKQWKAEKDQFFTKLAQGRQRCESFNFNNSFCASNRDKSFGDGSKTQRWRASNDESSFYRPSTNLGPKSVLKNIDNKKFNKILNATTVDEILRARRCPSGLDFATKSGLNKSQVILDRSYNSKLYWK